MTWIFRFVTFEAIEKEATIAAAIGKKKIAPRDKAKITVIVHKAYIIK